MTDWPSPRWAILVPFTAAGVYFLHGALVASARRRWGWGRGGFAGPMSRLSYGVIGCMFLATALVTGLEWETAPGWLSTWFVVNFLATFAVAIRDARKNRK